MQELAVTRIPTPEVLLKGEWNGLVYLITTYEENLIEHQESVREAIAEIKKDFETRYQHRFFVVKTKQEIVYLDSDNQYFSTLVQFEMKESY